MVISKLSNSIKIKKNQPSSPKSNPPYFSNGEPLGKCKHTIKIKTLKNER
jgi:hypothetical protein